MMARAAKAKVYLPPEDSHLADNLWDKEAIKQLEVVTNFMDSLDAAINRKVLQHGNINAAAAVHSGEDDPLHDGLWLEVMGNDPVEVRLRVTLRP